MNVALIGYGRMGKEIERAAAGRPHLLIKQIFYSTNTVQGNGLTKDLLKDIDVCIDFSETSAVLDNILSVASAGKNIVVGTTGWYDRLKDVEKIVERSKIGLLYSPNFSLGVNMFFQILTHAAHAIDKFDQYDIAIQETHHKDKTDSPSGTALAMGQLILQHVRRKKEILHETMHGEIKPQQLHVSSTRAGHIVGEHRVVIDSDADTIELVHTAKNRTGFAVGALVAAEWLRGKKGMYTMKDVLASI